jgi:CpeS-like protein
MNVMGFFEQCTGRWYSQRVSHHLAFRRQERGQSEIAISCFPADDPAVIALCELHGVDPQRALGGALVTWKGTMQADTANHDGKSLLVPVPDAADSPEGMLLRDLGYAEIVPVAGRYRMQENGMLYLVTSYENTETEERFWFGGPNLRFRSSLVKSIMGLNTTYCTEIRLAEGESLRQPPEGEILQSRLGINSDFVMPKASVSFAPFGG